jgi:DNA-binding transcriptional ArsR family regulator
MTTGFAEGAHLDKLVHEPARLAILTALDACANADFLFLQRLTGLTAGNLSAHLAKLEEGGLIEIEKQFIGRLPNTQVGLTKDGRAAVKRHWRGLRRLQRGGAQLRTERRRSAHVPG